MQYRAFGKTGEKISTLGFGCMRLPEFEKDGKWMVDQDKADEMLRRAFALGVNYFDTAPYYCNSNSEAAVGRALKPIRDKVLISTKFPLGDEVKSKDDYRRFLEQSLQRLDTDHIDFYHFWGMNKGSFDEKVLGLGLLDEAQKAKEEGLIRHISFSFHDKPAYIQYIIDTAGIMESMLIQYNLLDQSHAEMIDYAASKGLGVVAMGPVGGGRLAAPTELYKKLTGRESIATYELALRFVLGNPGMCCALSGMQNVDMVEKNAAVASLPEPMTEKEWQEIGRAMEEVKKFSELYCTGCAYCQPCPKGINIPRIFNAYTYHNVYGLTETAKNDYNGYRNNQEHPGATSEACIDCGMCEKKCPQHLQIRSELRRVEKILAQL